MRKSMIITVIASIFSLAIIALSVTFGWFLNVNKTDAENGDSGQDSSEGGKPSKPAGPTPDSSSGQDEP